MNLLHIESRPSKTKTENYEFLVECDNTKGGLKQAIDNLRKHATGLQVMSRNVESGIATSSGNVP